MARPRINIEVLSKRAQAEARAKRPKLLQRTGVKVGAAIALAGIAGAGVGTWAGRAASPHTYERQNPAMVQAAQRGKFHDYDLAAIQTHPALREISPRIIKHWGAITNIAGDRYNALAVIDTLSRTPSSAREAPTAAMINDWAKSSRMDRRADIIRRAAQIPNAEALFKDMYSLPSRRIETARHAFYGRGPNNWQYGSLRLGSHTNSQTFNPPEKRVPKDQSFRRLDLKSQRMLANSRR